jgi:outer membrane protein insertion porin family/translocation and assembly module TamA
MPRAIWKRSVSLRVACLVILACLFGACREEGAIKVTDLSFNGNKAVSTSDLKNVLATGESGWLPWSTKRYFDREEFDQDLKRIQAFYADRGYPRVRVQGVDVQFNDARDEVRVRIDIEEGTPQLVANVALVGFDELPEEERAKLQEQLPIKAGRLLDRQLVTASRDLAARTLRERGYAYASVRVTERDSEPERVNLVLSADSGPQTAFGPVTVVGNASVDENVIRRQLTFKEGDSYRAGRVTESQRRLYGLELFQFAHVEPRLGEDQPVQVPVTVTVAEGKHRRLRMGVGYGSEEKARATASWRHVNFLGGAKTATTDVKWSSLERGVRIGLTEPYFLRAGGSLQFTVSNWWTAEPTYDLRSYGGRVTFSNLFGSGSQSVADRFTRNELRTSYIREFEDYSISNEALADLSLRPRLIALGLDPRTGTFQGTLSAIELGFERNTSGRPLDPRTGYVASVHLERAGGALGGDFRYTEVVLEGRKYFEFGQRAVWANRIRLGTLGSADISRIPFFKRYFLGGSTSLRGWGRYEVSPLSGSGLPIGGRSMLEASSEVRIRLTRKLSAVAFIDTGNVWTDDWQFQLDGLRYAIGPGLRYDTPVGPVRVDFGKQLNPIPGLLIEGVPEERTWRVHFSIGQAF